MFDFIMCYWFEFDSKCLKGNVKIGVEEWKVMFG